MSILRFKSESDLPASAQARLRSASTPDLAAGAAPRVSGSKTGAAEAGNSGSRDKAPVGKRSKYSNRKTVVDGEKFDSLAEARRYQQLKLMLQVGEIAGLERQVSYEIIPKQMKYDGSAERACVYKADFSYRRAGKLIVEDVKGMRTKEYVIKRKLMLHVHGIEIVEVKA